jgi:aminoglycoside phosphotransferase (APT) family kinase protein
MNTEQLQQALAVFLSEHHDGEVEVSGFARMAGGASRAIYSFDACFDGEDTRKLVLRMDAMSAALQAQSRDEFVLLSVALEAGVTVPRVYWDGDETAGLGSKFFIMDRVDGEAIARKLLRDEEYARTRERLPAALARELARIHEIPADDGRLECLAPLSPDGPADEVRRYLAVLDLAGDGHPQPVLRFVARWLIRNAPADRPRTLVHGDFRIGNILFDREGLTAVLDWELAHFGDPMEDLGWLCVRAWRFGVDERAVGGLCDRERLFELYEREGGSPVDAAAVRYWEILGNWKWAVMCVMQAGRRNDGAYPDIELAAIGRRIADSEWEALALLEEDLRSARQA